MSTYLKGSAAQAAGSPARRLAARSPRYGERVIRTAFALCAALAVATTISIVFSLVEPAFAFFDVAPISEFLTGTVWAPRQGLIGVVPLVVGTLTIVFWAMLVALPLGLGAAIYLSEYAPGRVRKVVKPILEVLAGIPTVAIGYFGVYFLVPLLRDWWPGDFLGGPPTFFMAGAASVCVALMIVPIISSVSDDAMRSVPGGLRDGAYALGASKMQVAVRVVFPAAISGVVASIVLATSRAIGETMIVLMVAGTTPNVTFNPVDAVETMTAYIGVTATGDVATGTVDYNSLFAVGVVLFVLTLILNLVSIRLVRTFREVYQ